MKKVLLSALMVAFATVSFSQDTTITYKKAVVGKDTSLVRTLTINRIVKDTVNRKEQRTYLDKLNTSIQNNQESRKACNAECDRLDAFYKKEKARVKAELAK